MLVDSLAFQIEKSGCLDAFWGKLDRGEDAALAVASSARPFMTAARFAHKPQPTLVVVAGEDAAVAFARNVAAFVGEDRVLRFPERRDQPFAPKHPDARVVAQRMEAAHALASGRNVVVVASARSLVRLLPPAEANAQAPLSFHEGDDLADGVMPGVEEFGDLAQALEERGYANTGELDGPGTFAVHGGVIDVYPGNLVYPVRIDFFGDEVDEIRRIVPSTGQTVATLKSVEVYPVAEFSCTRIALARARKAIERQAQTNPALRDILEKLDGGLRFDGSDVLLPYLYDRTVTLGDYAGDGVLSVLVEPRSLVDDAAHYLEEVQGRAKGTGFSTKGLFAEPAELDFGGRQRAPYVSIMRVGTVVDEELPVKRVDVAGAPDKLFGKLRNLLDGGYTCVFSAPNYRAREDMKLAMVDHGLPIQERLELTGASDGEVRDAPEFVGDESGRPVNKGAEKRRLRRSCVNIVDAAVPLGMIIPKAKLALVSISDTQGAQAAARSRRVVDITEVTFPYKPGDYVVHAAHGVAFFKELVRREIDGTARDYLLLEYAEGDKLFVPVEQLDRVTRYVGPEGASPRLTRLNTSDWSRALSKARKATKKLAFDLVDVYARRAATQGFRFSPDTPWQREMEGSFPYQETPDQLAAIADVKADMQSARPMDRLICGDVGFGKTEIAIRAAFKATCDNKQVAVLVPTTVLAFQHYQTFKERLKEFPVRIEYLSRARKASEVKAILKDLADRKIDIIIGTHKLIGKDVKFNDLGLLIVDEEQKFGVAVKEKLKQMKVNVDTLTMSATPIPRTLQFSLMGARDLSVISTPPANRHPIQTEVHAFNDDIIKEAINFEMSRGGQIFFVNNRIPQLYELENTIHRLVPDARVVIGHGQMPPEKLEQAIIDFVNYDYDILLATTIIESGIDMPNTNTIIINDAQNFGLSELHQLRGRVGRSNRKAFCYLLTPPRHTFSVDARRRLQAIESFSELGSGIHIAMQDLDIRGAGNLLGAEQSGFIADLGYETYQKILKEAVEELKNDEFSDLYYGADSDTKPEEFVSECTIESDLEILFPANYVPQESERISLYQELDNMERETDIRQFCERLEDRFGRIPHEAMELIRVVRLRRLAKQLGIEKVGLKQGYMYLYFVSDEHVAYYQSAAFGRILGFLQKNPKLCKLREINSRRSLAIKDITSVESAVSVLEEVLQTLPV